MEPTRKSHTYWAPGLLPFKYNPYIHLSNLRAFVDYVVNRLEWETLPMASILDVGCGTVRPQLGEWLHARFPEISCVVALDKDPGVISQCRKEYNGYAPIQFVDGGIDENLVQINLTEEWVGKFDKVMSLNCFHLVPDLIYAFDNLYLVTKPSGEIAVAFCLWSGFIEMVSHIMELKKWDYYKRTDAPRAPCLQDSPKDVPTIARMIRGRGFNIIHMEKIQVEQPYESEEECRSAVSFGFSQERSLTKRFVGVRYSILSTARILRRRFQMLSRVLSEDRRWSKSLQVNLPHGAGAKNWQPFTILGFIVLRVKSEKLA